MKVQKAKDLLFIYRWSINLITSYHDVEHTSALSVPESFLEKGSQAKQPCKTLSLLLGSWRLRPFGFGDTQTI